MDPGRDEYPATGVEAVVFPPPRTLAATAWLADLGRQLWYPVRKVFGPSSVGTTPELQREPQAPQAGGAHLARPPARALCHRRETLP